MKYLHRTSMFVAAIAAVSLWSSAASAVLIYDVNDLNAQGVSSPTQASWIAVNLTGINNVTFAGVGGVNLADRNRGNNPFPNTNTDGAGGDIAHKDMWEDFIFAQEIAADVALPAGMDITVAGLSALTTYDVRLWAYDDISGSDVSGETPNMAWNGNAMMIGPTDPTSLNDQVVTYQAMSNGAGALMLEGRIVNPRRADCCNVFVNGFELTETETETQVPEPTTLALMGLGLAGIGYKRHRSKKAA